MRPIPAFLLGMVLEGLLVLSVMYNTSFPSNFYIVSKINEKFLTTKEIGNIDINNFQNVCIGDTIKLILVKKN
jgi:hypothetical protein